MRYGMAVVGPVGSAAAQFVLALQMLHALTPASFGAFSFLLVTFQFSLGLWSALFCAPLPIVLTEPDTQRRESMANAFFAMNLLLGTLAFGLFWLIGAAVGLESIAAALFAAYVAFALLRWFARAYAYAMGAPLQTVTSDIVYTVALFAAIGLMMVWRSETVTAPCAALLASTVVALLPFGRRFLARQFVHLSWKDAPRYRDVWTQHARWSLAGVVSTEATGNAHAYIVTLFAGPAAFATLAASALLIRPIGVVMNALSEFERPQMARQLAKGRLDLALRALIVFRAVLVAVWVASAALGTAILILAPHVLFPARYELSYIATGAALWMAVAFVRLLRMPESTLLQAAGVFRPLAWASVVSAFASLPAVTLLLLAKGPLWSIAGVLIGEAVFAVWIWRQTRHWRIRMLTEAARAASPAMGDEELAAGAAGEGGKVEAGP
ncbi:hypothetical protein AXW83_18525 [Bosea sp. PAMC 26642]|nr:hypothetical protein AXW83_18525 [Bosea sp. PAMC 26642]